LTFGSCDRAAEIVANSLLAAGATNLQAKAGAFYAAFGENCWVTDRKTAECLRRWDGRPYHRGSVARARRTLAKRGIVESKRIYPNGRLPSGMRSGQGTCNKRIRWETLGRKNPLSRPAKREGKQLHAQIDNVAGRNSRFLSSNVPRSPRNLSVPPELAAMLARIAALPTTTSHNASRSTSPPSTLTSDGSGRVTETPEEAKRRLEEWAAKHEKRGPP
jgi:hypothetical protein